MLLSLLLTGHPRHVLHGSPGPCLSAPEPGALVPLVSGARPVVIVTLVSWEQCSTVQYSTVLYRTLLSAGLTYKGVEQVLLVLVVDLHQPSAMPLHY